MPKIPKSIKDIRGKNKQIKNDLREWRSMYDYRWEKARLIFLRDHPLCECYDCIKKGLLKTANVVHHKEAHKGNYELFWDQNNWMAMNKICHDKYTAGVERR